MKQFEHCVKKWSMFNWVVGDTLWYLEPFNDVQENEERISVE